MLNIKRLSIPASQSELDSLCIGDVVYLSGTLITGRDAAHKRIMEYLDRGLSLPFQIKNQAIYYTGPCPPRPGQVIGACGPTTSSRMDLYTPRLLDLGLKIMIGKGHRSPSVLETIKKNRAVYFAATGGAGALISQCVKESVVCAFEDLGPEAVYKLTVVDLPLIVAIDTRGNNLYDIGPNNYRKNSF